MIFSKEQEDRIKSMTETFRAFGASVEYATKAVQNFAAIHMEHGSIIREISNLTQGSRGEEEK